MTDQKQPPPVPEISAAAWNLWTSVGPARLTEALKNFMGLRKLLVGFGFTRNVRYDDFATMLDEKGDPLPIEEGVDENGRKYQTQTTRQLEKSRESLVNCFQRVIQGEVGPNTTVLREHIVDLVRIALKTDPATFTGRAYMHETKSGSWITTTSFGVRSLMPPLPPRADAYENFKL